MAHDLSRLPKWARDHIATLERDLEAAHAAQAVAVGAERMTTRSQITLGACIILNPFSERPLRLDAGTAIEFRLGDDWHTGIRVRIEGDGLDVNGVESIAIEPRASNTAFVRLRPRR